jgi:hypothetical protein
MEKKRTYYIVIIISILIHLLLIWLIAFYPTNSERLLSFEQTIPSAPAETIFYQQPEPQEPLQDWAQLKPHASKLGPSMELEQEAALDNHDQSTDTLDKVEQEESPQQQPAQEESQTQTENGVQNITALVRDSVLLPEKKAPAKKATATKKKEAQKILASMANNYLEQLCNEGNNLIKTIGGNPDALPTKDQLLYERYLAKLHWCLNNAQAILQDPSAFKEAIHATMKIQFLLDREGKMSAFTIHQSSGSVIADAYIKELFTYASSSFPPLPSFIKQNPLPLFYTVLINWEQSHYTHFARQ